MTHRLWTVWRAAIGAVAAGFFAAIVVALSMGQVVLAVIAALTALVALTALLLRNRGEQAFRDSEERFRQLSDAAFEGIIIHDGGQILDANDAFARMSGYTAKELIGRDVLTLLAPESHEAARRHVAEQYDPPREYVSLYKDGSSARVECQARSIVWKGRPARVVAIRDVTERRRAEQALRDSEAQWERTFDAVSELVCMLDANHRIMRVNRAMAERLGGPPERFVGQTCYHCVHGLDQPPDFCPHSKLLADGQPHTVEIHEENLHGDFLVNVSPLVDAAGKLVGSVHVAHDITERKCAEEALRAREDLYRRILDTSLDSIVLTDLDGNIVMANRAAEESYGPAVRGALIGKMGFDLVVGEDRDKVLGRMSELIEKGEVKGVEFRATRSDGTHFPAEINASIVKDASGNPVGIVGVVRDVTERARIEAQLRESGNLVSMLLNATDDAGYLISEEMTILAANESAARRLGRKVEDLAGKRADEVLPPDLARSRQGQVEEVFRSGRPVQFEDRRNNRDLLNSVYPLFDAEGRVHRVAIFSRDITERKRAAEELARTGALLDSIRDAQSLYISERDPQQVYSVMLDALVRMTDSERGFLAEVLPDRKSPTGAPITNIIAWDEDGARRYEDMKKRGIEYFDLNNLAGEPVLTGKVVICNDVPNRPGARPLPEGHPPLGAFMGVPLFFGGELVGVAGVANRPGGYDARIADFLKPFTATLAGLIHAVRIARTERQALDALRGSERRMRELMENVRLIALIFDREGRVTFSNDFCAELTGRSREELVGCDWFETFIPEDERGRAKEVFREAIAGDRLAAHYENDILTRRGERRTIAWDNTTLADADGKVIGAASLGRDVTHQRELEDEVRHAQKMEAVGRLAGGVAHDLNNMLTPILGWAELLLLDTPPDDARRDDLLHVRLAAERARDLTRQLLAFSRKQILQLRPARLNDVVRGFEQMLRRTIREDVRITLNFEASSGAVLADVGQIEQVLANLALNAQDAMPAGGEMTVEVANVELDDAWVKRHPAVSPGAYVMLAVSDTGVGMPPPVLEHLFEPFFTTKANGQGTGLGLATVYGVVRQHGGAVVVESEEGRGSTFRVYLPRVDAPAVNPAAKAEAGELRGGAERVLIVEDNEMVRELTCEMLRERGYAVACAATPLECFEMVESRGERFDLLVTDMIMPQVNGRDLYERLIRTIPNLRVVVMSGYADSLVTTTPGSRFGRFFIQKPFTLRALTDTVRAALDQKE